MSLLLTITAFAQAFALTLPVAPPLPVAATQGACAQTPKVKVRVAIHTITNFIDRPRLTWSARLKPHGND
jgi:hypothetical protein